jgi:hypothetical protein
MGAYTVVLISVLSFLPAHVTRDVTGTRAEAKKVWTNEDLKNLRANSPLSLIGMEEGLEASLQATSTQRPWIREEDPRWYAYEIGARRDSLDEVEGQLDNIAEIQKAGVGISDEFPLDKNSPGLFLPGTVFVFESQATELESEIDALQDLARQNNIAPSAWR